MQKKPFKHTYEKILNAYLHKLSMKKLIKFKTLKCFSVVLKKTKVSDINKNLYLKAVSILNQLCLKNMWFFLVL